jgi:hypothetical protein
MLYVKECTVISDSYCAHISQDYILPQMAMCAYGCGEGSLTTINAFPYIAWFFVEACGKIFEIPYPFFNQDNNCARAGMGKEVFGVSELGFNINTNFADDLLSINIETEKEKATATLEIYTISGKRMGIETFELSKGTYNYSTSGYTSGTYIYSITIDGNQLFDGQFVIVR